MSDQSSKATHVYKHLSDGSELVVDVYSPVRQRSGNQQPAIIYFHGGGWRGGCRDQFAPHSMELNKLGIVVLTVEYRTKNSHGTEPRIALADAKSAMRWTRINAVRLGIDLNRIAAVGSSAGGHLAAASLMCPGFDDPMDDLSVPIEANALILFNPVTDNGPDGYGYEVIQSDFPAFSPAHNIRPGLPPTLYMLGTCDNLIPVSTAEAFRDQMIAAGNACKLILYEGAEHGIVNYKDSGTPLYKKTLADTIAFLTKLGWTDDPSGQAGLSRHSPGLIP